MALQVGKRLRYSKGNSDLPAALRRLHILTIVSLHDHDRNIGEAVTVSIE